MPPSAPRLDPRAVKVRFEEQRLVVDLADGRSIAVPLLWYPRLAKASKPELANWRFIGNGEGIHWEGLDEDLSTEGLLAVLGLERTVPTRFVTEKEHYIREEEERLIAEVRERPARVRERQDASSFYTGSLTALKAEALTLLEKECGPVRPLRGTRSIYIVADHVRLNLRSSRQGRGSEFDFDVSPDYYELEIVDCFMFVCGYAEQSLIFTTREMKNIASLTNGRAPKGMRRLVFDMDTLEMLGAGNRRVPIATHVNAFPAIKKLLELRSSAQPKAEEESTS